MQRGKFQKNNKYYLVLLCETRAELYYVKWKLKKILKLLLLQFIDNRNQLKYNLSVIVRSSCSVVFYMGFFLSRVRKCSKNF